MEVRHTKRNKSEVRQGFLGQLLLCVYVAKIRISLDDISIDL